MTGETCWHRLRVMGAKELFRRRLEAGWPPERAVPIRGWRVVCTTCLEDIRPTPGREP